MPLARTVGAAAVAVAALLALAGVARGTPLPGEVPCAGDAALRCATVRVPLDRSGVLAGGVALAARRLPARGDAQARVAIVGLAGGPGQAAVPLAHEFADVLGAGLGDHDLVVYDPRGAGASGALRCSAATRAESSLAAARDCARQLGARRGHYTTEDAVADLEAIRVAGGYDRLTLYAVSYGTKVALRYAARHPDRVERLVLDSVLAPDGPDPLLLSTFAALRRVLPALCSGDACAGVTRSPLGDVAALRRRLGARVLRARLVTSRGRPRAVGLDAIDLLSVVRAGDFNPTLRADLPAAVRSALAHDGAPLARLAARAAGLPGAVAGDRATDDGVDDALFLATTCEEAPFPWRRAASPLARLAEAARRAASLAPARVAPFDRRSALLGGLVPLCVTWPDASPAPPRTGPLPPVPSLILDGAADVRTPAEDAAAVASAIPGSRLLVVPRTGHSVLGSDLSGCAQAAVSAFLTGAPVAGCAPAEDRFPPTRIPPRSLARLHPTAGVPRAAGRTLHAVGLTLQDAERALLAHAIGAGRAPGPGVALGGLRAGSLVVTRAGVRLRGYSLVPGVTLSGLVPSRTGATARLRVGGRAAARGTLALRSGSATGRLGGRRIRVSAAAAARAAGAGLLPRLKARTPLLARVR